MKRRLNWSLLVIIVLSWPGCNIEKDRFDARRAASRIHSQLQENDFISIYRESGQSFKEVGDEPAFVTRMNQFFEEKGSLKHATSVAYETGVDSDVGRKHILSFDLEFERGHARERLTLTRSEEGHLRLWDLAFDPLP